MDIDPIPSSNDDQSVTSGKEARAHRLNSWVALTIALLATFMGICKVRDDNLVQAMQQAQTDKLDHWSYYQARNIRQEVAQAAADQLELIISAQTPSAQQRAAPLLSRYKTLVADQQKKKEEERTKAVAADSLYNALNYHDDQFDLADALTAIAISLLALTSLTQKRWLFWVAIVATVFGVIMGLAGLLSWQLHPDALSRLLS